MQQPAGLKHISKEVGNEETAEQHVFDTYQEAENCLKRKPKAWLSMDDVLIEKYVEKYGVKEATLRSQFEKTMQGVYQPQ